MPVAEWFLLLTVVGPQEGAIVLNQITLRYVCLLPPVASRFVVLRSVTVSIVCTTGLRDVLVVRTYLVGLRRELDLIKRDVCDFMLAILGSGV